MARCGRGRRRRIRWRRVGGDWKLIEYHEHTLTGTGRSPELFNLKDDPAESRNLAATEPARLRELLAKLAAFRAATAAQMPTVNPRHDPVAAKKRKKGDGG